MPFLKRLEKMIKLAKKLLVMLIVSIFMISMVAATAYAVNTPTDEKKVEHKEKKIKNYKIKWSANGGKIGTKKTVTTTVKKGSKVKLAKTPKRTGYSFQGWFSKKSGGKKITKNTKPTKSITYFAKWKKKLNTQEKALIGTWEDRDPASEGAQRQLWRMYKFYDDGTFYMCRYWYSSAFDSSIFDAPYNIKASSNMWDVRKGTFTVRSSIPSDREYKSPGGTIYRREAGKYTIVLKMKVYTPGTAKEIDSLNFGNSQNAINFIKKVPESKWQTTPGHSIVPIVSLTTNELSTDTSIYVSNQKWTLKRVK
jgi:uncharacterized repeat protein (TIGR02543 family)